MSTKINQSTQINSTSEKISDVKPSALVTEPKSITDDLNNIRYVIGQMIGDNWYDYSSFNYISGNLKSGNISITSNPITVSFSTSFIDVNYVLNISMIGSSIIPYVITNKTVSGFTILFADSEVLSGYSIDYIAIRQ